MNILNLTLTKKLRPFTDIYLDGEIIVPKRKKRKYVAEHSTNNDTAELVIKSYSRFQTRWWFFIEMFFFLVSIFGIFDQRFGKYCYTTHCKFKINLQSETNVKLRIISPRSNGAVVKVESDCETQEIENIYKIDEKAKKGQKTLRIFKIITALVILAVAIVLIVV